jgi:hypothetical protein
MLAEVTADDLAGEVGRSTCWRLALDLSRLAQLGQEALQALWIGEEL